MHQAQVLDKMVFSIKRSEDGWLLLAFPEAVVTNVGLGWVLYIAIDAS
jgi:hypothetical protein